MKDDIIQLLQSILAGMGAGDVVPQVTVPETSEHGDYATNVALVLAKRLKKSPMDIALEVKRKFEERQKTDSHKGQHHNSEEIHQNISAGKDKNSVLQDIERIDVAAPGFLNIKISEAKLISQLSEVLNRKESYGTGQNLAGKKLLVEFAHPNTHKAFHIGHLRNITTGEAIVRLLESQGAEVVRGNYQGDVGMHIAKALYALSQIPEYKDRIAEVRKQNVHARVEFLGKAYTAGSQAFEKDENAQNIIKDYNYLVYAAAQKFADERGIPSGTTDYMKFVKGRAHDVDIVYGLWKETRQWSLDYFDTIYKRVGTHYDRFYFESECLAGVDYAREAVKKGVLEESDGAVIFNGKPYGLDTRVFVNSLGLPTYEGKELALARLEFGENRPLDRIIHVVGPEQASFFRVTFKAEELLGLQKDQQFHLIYGWVKLKHGKMSSRLGNVVLGEWLLDEAEKAVLAILEESGTRYDRALAVEIAVKAAVAAVKYAFLKVSTRSEIAFDFGESVSFSGDSGPYLQYTYARCRSVMEKACKAGLWMTDDGSWKDNQSEIQNPASDIPLNVEERAVARRLAYFPDTVAAAARDYSPNVLCTYLFDMAQEFNLFYNKHQILRITDDGLRMTEKQTAENPKSDIRLALTAATAQVLKNGLYLLGIEAPERM